jgi:hypothetical protein
MTLETDIEDEDAHRDFLGRRLLINLFRIAHVAGLAGVSAWVLVGDVAGNASLVVNGAAFAFLLVASGLGIFGIDAWSNPNHFRQINGLAMVLKLILVGLMVAWPQARLPLFWVILVYSVAISHAAGRIRHKRLF